MVWGGLEVVWWWFGANMAGQRNKYAFKFLLQLLILSQKHILGVKKVVWGGLDVVWRWFGIVWGGLGCFHGPAENVAHKNTDYSQNAPKFVKTFPQIGQNVPMVRKVGQK